VNGGIYLHEIDSNQGCSPPFRGLLAQCRTHSLGAMLMLDIVMLAIGFVSFALLIGYVYGCEQL